MKFGTARWRLSASTAIAPKNMWLNELLHAAAKTMPKRCNFGKKYTRSSAICTKSISH